MKRPVLVALASGAALVATATATPALAGGTTTTTFAVTGGSLSISAPATVDFGSAVAGGTLQQSLGAVRVDDLRGVAGASWTATVVATNFKTGGGTAAEIIPASNVKYASGAGSLISGVATLVPGQATSLLSVVIDTAKTAMTGSGAGVNSGSWTPTVSITIPGTALSGAYSGSIVHSVS